MDGTALATRLMGDSIGTNIFMLGFALQKGLLPVSLEAIEEAIRLNGVAVQANLETLSWGRLVAYDHERVLQVAEAAGSDDDEAPLSQTLDEVIARRERLLTDWQDAAYAADYRAFVDKVRATESAQLGDSSRLTETVARVLARLMAYKDEFEVARLYTSGDFVRRLRREFDGDVKLRFHMAPPLISRRNDKGELIKRAFGGWMFRVFGWMTRFKALRKTPLNIFGYSAERRMERALIGEYRALVTRVLGRLSADNAEQAVELLRLYEDIKGYGHVKERNCRTIKAQEAELLAAYENPQASATAQTDPLVRKAS